MKLLRSWMVAVGLFGILFLVASGQEAESRFQTPSVASVKAGESLRLVAGQVFIFQLRFDRAPDGYGGGQIRYTFENEQASSSYGNRMNIPASSGGQIDLHDGQAIYTISLPITDSMVPGIWKLTAVSLGRSAFVPVAVADNVTFEIPQLPRVLIHIQAPNSVTAGQRLVLRVNLEEFPKGLKPECVVMLGGSLDELSTNGQHVPAPFHVALEAVELKSDQPSYEMSGSFAPDLPSGAWQGAVNITSYPRPAPGRGIPMNRYMCRTPPLEGNTKFLFVLRPPVNLVTPTSVAVTVNPSQIQLMLGEADRLKAKAQHLGEQLTSKDVAANRALLLTSVQEAVADVDRTEESFKAKGVGQDSARPVNIFFDDIRLNYGDALKVLTSESARVRQTRPRLEFVNGIPGGSSPRLTPASRAVLASILHNARAYEVVASTKALTFNLDVFSEPSGATISYKLTGGTYEPLDHETDWRIENLARAVYSILLQKTGYQDKEASFDAINNTGTSIRVRLERKRGTR